MWHCLVIYYGDQYTDLGYFVVAMFQVQIGRYSLENIVFKAGRPIETKMLTSKELHLGQSRQFLNIESKKGLWQVCSSPRQNLSHAKSIVFSSFP